MDGARVSALAIYRLQEGGGVVQKEQPRRLQRPGKARLSLSKVIQKKPKHKGKKKVSPAAGCSPAGREEPEPPPEGDQGSNPDGVAPASEDAERRSRGPRKRKAQDGTADLGGALPPTAPAGGQGEAAAEERRGASRKRKAKRRAAEPRRAAPGEAGLSPSVVAEKPNGVPRTQRTKEAPGREERGAGVGGERNEGPRKPKAKAAGAGPERAAPPTAREGEEAEGPGGGAPRGKKAERWPAEEAAAAAEEEEENGRRRAPKRKRGRRDPAEPETASEGERGAAPEAATLAEGLPGSGGGGGGAGAGAASLQQLLQELGQIPHSKRRAARLFEWLIAPLPADHFFSWLWEKEAVLVRRGRADYYRGLFSTAELDAVLRAEDVRFGLHLDAARYRHGRRETLNPPGRALPATAWALYRDGCSLRLLCPQAFSAAVWQVLSVLQEHFGSMVGANAYLTPPGSQGFAPHYDDIEAFVLQLEGRKLWRVYKPREPAEELPQFSSPNLGPQGLGRPVLQAVLEPGDLLYFPRGFIHQAECEPGVHSLHLTLSTFQRNSWGDLLEALLPAALQAALEDDVEFRRGLPRDYLDYMGAQHSESGDPRRSPFLEKVRRLLARLAQHAPVDAAADQRAKAFLHDCLPPVLSERERALSVHGLPARWEAGAARGVGAALGAQTRVRLLRHGLTRLVSEGDGVLLYYTVENSRVYHQGEPKCLEVDARYADGIEYLFSSYPGFVQVAELPCDSSSDRLGLATLLFEKGLLITKKPLAP